jgi:hypothetical protein
MTGSTRRADFERLVVAWLDEAVGAGAPDYLDETLAHIDHVSQRPAWLSPWRWLPMRTLTLTRIEVPRLVPYVVTLGLLVLLAIAIALAAGSQRRLPPPFGIAATGSFVYDSAGDLHLAASDGSVRSLTATPDLREFGGVWSRDGTRIAFAAVASRSGDASLWVMDADGSGARLVSGELRLESSLSLPPASWSPDGRRLVFAADERLYVVDATGDNLAPLGDGSVLAAEPAWSPRGDLIAFIGHEGPTADDAVYMIRVDDGATTRASSTRGGIFALLPQWAPDGLRITYHGGANNEDVFVATLEGAAWTERALVTGATIDSWPTWSNDGGHISFVRSTSTDHGSVVVVNADGSGLRELESGTIGWAPHCWTPDDRSIIAPTAEEGVSIGQESRPGFVVLSVDGSRSPVTLATPERQAFATCSWQRLVP